MGICLKAAAIALDCSGFMTKVESRSPPNMSSPSLGIFWIDGNDLICFSVPLDRAEHSGGYGNYPHGHVQMWPLVLRSHPHLRRRTYEQVPRGRITYDAALDRFALLLPRRYTKNCDLQQRLIRQYQLPRQRTVVMSDDHYDPPDSHA